MNTWYTAVLASQKVYNFREAPVKPNNFNPEITLQCKTTDLQKDHFQSNSNLIDKIVIKVK